MQFSKIILVLGIFLEGSISTPCIGNAVSPCQISLNATQEKQWHTLTYKVRCPTCMGQVVAESSAPLAQKIQCFLAQGIQKGKSSQELLKALEDRFGWDIKEVDSMEPHTFLLWGLSIFFLGGVCFFVFRNIRHL